MENKREGYRTDLSISLLKFGLPASAKEIDHNNGHI